MLVGTTGTSRGRQSVTVLCQKTSPLAHLLHAQPSLQKRRKVFLFAFSFGAVRAAWGGWQRGTAGPQQPHCVLPAAEAPTLLFSSQGCTRQECSSGMLWHSFLPAAAHHPTEHPQAPRLARCRVGTRRRRARSLIPPRSLIPSLQSLALSSRKHLRDEMQLSLAGSTYNLPQCQSSRRNLKLRT